MSTLKSKIYTASAITVIVLGLLLNNKVSSGSNSDMELKNLAALEVSAGEMYCDQVNNNVCTVGEMMSRGNLVIR